MRQRLLWSPWWVSALFLGVFFGTAMGVTSAVQQHTTVLAGVVTGLLGGVFFGAAMSPFVRRQRQALLEASDQLPDDTGRRRAARAVSRGPAPADGATRVAALGLARYHRSELRRRRRLILTVFGLLTVLEVGTAVAEPSPRRVLGAVFFVVLLGFQLWYPRHLDRRIALLGDPDLPVAPDRAQR